MAKQRGIHQISGKINNLCYYEQKYIKGGLIRRINEAMSERLKTDPVFERTRFANTIFGGCSMVASTLLSFFGNRNTFLFKPYRQAILTREVKKYLTHLESGQEYPFIMFYSQGQTYLPLIINSIVKNPIFNHFNELEKIYRNLSLDDSKDFTFNRDSLVSYCEKYKCIGVQLSISRAHYIYSTQYNYETKAYDNPDNNAGGRVSYVNWYLNDDDGDAVLSTMTGEVDDAVTFWIIYAMPILSTYKNRPVFGETGAACGVVTFSAS